MRRPSVGGRHEKGDDPAPACCRMRATGSDAAALAVRLGLGLVLVDEALHTDGVNTWRVVLGRVALPDWTVGALAAGELLLGLLVLGGAFARPAGRIAAAWGALGLALLVARPPIGFWVHPAMILGLGLTVTALGGGALSVDALRGRARAATEYAWWPARVAVAAVMMNHGFEILGNLDAWTRDFVELGIPAAGVSASLVGFAELAGGIGIFAGILTRFSSAVLAVVLTVAVAVAWWPTPMWRGWDLDVLLLGALVGLAIVGPGRPTLASIAGRAVRDPEEWVWLRLSRAK